MKPTRCRAIFARGTSGVEKRKTTVFRPKLSRLPIGSQPPSRVERSPGRLCFHGLSVLFLFAALCLCPVFFFSPDRSTPRICTALAVTVPTFDTTAWDSTDDTEDETRTVNTVTEGDGDATGEEAENYDGSSAGTQDDARTQNTVTEGDGDYTGKEDETYNGVNRSSTLNTKRGWSSLPGVATRVSTIQSSGWVGQKMKLAILISVALFVLFCATFFKAGKQKRNSLTPAKEGDGSRR